MVSAAFAAAYRTSDSARYTLMAMRDMASYAAMSVHGGFFAAVPRAAGERYEYGCVCVGVFSLFQRA